MHGTNYNSPGIFFFDSSIILRHKTRNLLLTAFVYIMRYATTVECKQCTTYIFVLAILPIFLKRNSDRCSTYSCGRYTTRLYECDE